MILEATPRGMNVFNEVEFALSLIHAPRRVEVSLPSLSSWPDPLQWPT
jgi:hypothetical protein